MNCGLKIIWIFYVERKYMLHELNILSYKLLYVVFFAALVYWCHWLEIRKKISTIWWYWTDIWKLLESQANKRTISEFNSNDWNTLFDTIYEMMNQWTVTILKRKDTQAISKLPQNYTPQIWEQSMSNESQKSNYWSIYAICFFFVFIPLILPLLCNAMKTISWDSIVRQMYAANSNELKRE